MDSKYDILAVDDEQDNLQLLRRTLRRKYNMTTASCGDEALELMKHKRYDLIISDHKMPGMDGTELLKYVYEQYPDTIRLLITAYTDVPILIEAINTGKIYRYIKKPWSPEEVVNIVEKALESHKLNTENIKLVQDFKELFSGTISAITEALDAKDSYTFGRSKRVSLYSIRIAETMQLSTSELSKIEVAGLLHDIGMIGISETILNKPERLTEEEFNSVKKHVEQGVTILQDIKQLSSVVDIIKYHHERFDGKGYPYMVQADEIPMGARIIAVSDAFDGMTSDRPYRKGMDIEKAINIVKENAGTQFDPQVVEVFLRIVHKAVEDIKEMKKLPVDEISETIGQVE